MLSTLFDTNSNARTQTRMARKRMRRRRRRGCENKNQSQRIQPWTVHQYMYIIYSIQPDTIHGYLDIWVCVFILFALNFENYSKWDKNKEALTFSTHSTFPISLQRFNHFASMCLALCSVLRVVFKYQMKKNEIKRMYLCLILD